MMPLIAFVDENKRSYINRDAKMYDLINQEKWNAHSLSSLLPPNVLADVKTVSVPCSFIEDRV